MEDAESGAVPRTVIQGRRDSQWHMVLRKHQPC